jgi:hypothetical protein
MFFLCMVFRDSMKAWILFLSSVVILMTILYFLQTHEGFEQIDFANRQKNYFYDRMNKGILSNPGLNLSELNSAVSSTDLYLPISKDRDYTTYFTEDPENAFREQDMKFCSGARMPKDLPTRVRGSSVACGWYFHPTQISVGALGTRTGPIFRDNLRSGGRWIWNLNEAQKAEELKRCKRLRDCSLLQLEEFNGVCGFCKEKGHGIPILSNGTAKYPEDVAGSSGESIIISPNECIEDDEVIAEDGTACMNLGRPSPDNSIRLYTKSECDTLGGDFRTNGECLKPNNSGSFSLECRALNIRPARKQTTVRSICDTDAQGILSRECLLRIAKSTGFNESGAVMRLLKSNTSPNSTDRLAIQTLKSVGIEIPENVLGTGVTDVKTAGAIYRRIFEMTRSAPSNIARQAALWMAVGTKEFDNCDLDGKSTGPFPTQCLQQAFRSAGCQPAGAKYPSERNAVSEMANMTWEQVNAAFRKTYDAMQTDDPTKQNIALRDCLGRGTDFYVKPSECQ